MVAASPPDLRTWRKERRAALIAARQAMPQAEHRRASGALLRHLEAGFPGLATQRVGAYWPIRREFDPRPFLQALIAAGGAVALPVVVGAGRPLEFRPWHPGARMASGVYDIPYPADGPPVTPDILLVALLGFDAAGFRLGYGAGYYDRTLAALTPRPLAVGVGFELGRLPTIYPQPHDIAMDWIVTEAGRFRRAGDRLVAD